MSKVVFITALKTPNGVIDYEEYCLNTWRSWVETQEDTHLFIYREPLPAIQEMPPTWQRWHVFDILDAHNIDYEQVAMIDLDTMVRWDCPDFFSLTGDKMGIINDPFYVGWISGSIQIYQGLFPNILLDWTEYFNAGIVILNKSHRDFLKKFLDFYVGKRDILKALETAKLGTDQTPLNFLVKQEGVKTNYLSRKFNFGSLRGKGPISSLYFIEAAYIWHFCGLDQKMRLESMKAAWEEVKLFYTNSKE